tara:strand:- start:56 stop:1468 length:1413 start_codon:yes stop_codon:yes gene_type:complete
MILRELTTKVMTKTVREILTERKKEEGGIFLDESFQVGTIEESRWGYAEKSRFFKSVLLGRAISPIVWIDVKACYEYWKQVGTDNESKDYFKKLLDQGYVYVSLDGNNRTITLFDVDGGKVGLPSGIFHLLNIPNIQVKRNSNKIGKGLVQPLVDKFYNTKIQIVVYTDISKDEAGQVFRDINDGLTLNNHQKRQSYSSYLADWVRQIRKDFKESLTKIFGKKEIITLKADEFIAKCLCYTVNKEYSGAALDSLYKEPGLVISSFLTKRDTWFQSTMKSFMKEIKRYKWTSKNSLFDLWVIISEYKTDDNTKILNMNKFVTSYYNQLTNLSADKTVYNSPDKKLKEKVLDYSGLLSKSLNKKVGEYRRNIIRNLVENDLANETVIVQQESPENRFFTRKQKQELWKKQDGICPKTKKHIPLEDIFDHTQWHADHILAYNKGGRTVIENGQLISAKSNLRKSDKDDSLTTN